jgi:glycosyltransferase involved in cell wall biosynthesis
MSIRRVFYAAGPGRVIQSHEHWKRGEQNPTEVSVTYSSQLQDFCREIGAEAYIVSHPPERGLLRDGPFTLEHRPKPMRGARGPLYHLSEILYGLGLLATALRFRSDLAVVDSGSTHYFLLALFRLLGIRVVPVLYNSLWPSGFYPTKPIPRLVFWLDDHLFWRRVPEATPCISPECQRQVEELTGGRQRGPLPLVLAQYRPGYFEAIPPPPPHGQSPFRIMFIGRMLRIKGVFDILEIARKVEERAPGRVVWEVCGTGADAEEVRRLRDEMGLQGIVELPGWVTLENLQEIYGRSHAAIVPTRSSFIEGLAMTAVEAVLAGRPLITNPVVPAIELLAPACVECRTNDVDSYVEGVLRLVSDEAYYERLRLSCGDLQGPFYDRRYGLASVLKESLAQLL